MIQTKILNRFIYSKKYAYIKELYLNRWYLWTRVLKMWDSEKMDTAMEIITSVSLKTKIEPIQCLFL